MLEPSIPDPCPTPSPDQVVVCLLGFVSSEFKCGPSSAVYTQVSISDPSWHRSRPLRLEKMGKTEVPLMEQNKPLNSVYYTCNFVGSYLKPVRGVTQVGAKKKIASDFAFIIKIKYQVDRPKEWCSCRTEIKMVPITERAVHVLIPFMICMERAASLKRSRTRNEEHRREMSDFQEKIISLKMQHSETPPKSGSTKQKEMDKSDFTKVKNAAVLFETLNDQKDVTVTKDRHLSTRKLMAQNTAECMVLVLMHFPALNLRMPEAGVPGRASERLSAGGLVPELTTLSVQSLGSEQPGGQVSSAHAACETWGDASAPSVTGCVSAGDTQ
ncbi:hypothetical protein E5288_WYG002858 [Bos mutus]|uniref:Uncharacterized protein n=1 Tax=Bos mutus TaxID=72004 RepID=A0A6B0RUK1_9CETA|nr:hypothetical protein [Bos mutus]